MIHSNRQCKRPKRPPAQSKQATHMWPTQTDNDSAAKRMNDRHKLRQEPQERHAKQKQPVTNTYCVIDLYEMSSKGKFIELQSRCRTVQG